MNWHLKVLPRFRHVYLEVLGNPLKNCCPADCCKQQFCEKSQISQLRANLDISGTLYMYESKYAI